MSALTRPRAPIIDTAIQLGQQWCQGHLIDGAPALAHALKVARKVDEHLPTASPDLLAAMIVHDAPFFAPADLDLDVALIAMLSYKVSRIVRAIEAEHDAPDHSVNPEPEGTDADVFVAGAADKIVSIGAILRRANRSTNTDAFWRARPAFVARVPYFRAFCSQAARRLPSDMAAELDALVRRAEQATRVYA